MEFEAFGVFTPPICFRGGPGNLKTLNVMASLPDFHTHKPGRESCATIVDPLIVSHLEYGYGKNLGFSCPIDSARTRQAGELRNWQGISSAEVIRDYIKRLPDLSVSGTSSLTQQA